MSFADDITRFNRKVEGLVDEVFVNSANAAHASIKYGSPVTGAPGQPVASGETRDSWGEGPEFPSRDVAVIATADPNARRVEDGLEHYRNHGPHSLALTIVGFPQLVSAEVRKLTGGG